MSNTGSRYNSRPSQPNADNNQPLRQESYERLGNQLGVNSPVRRTEFLQSIGSRPDILFTPESKPSPHSPNGNQAATTLASVSVFLVVTTNLRV